MVRKDERECLKTPSYGLTWQPSLSGNREEGSTTIPGGGVEHQVGSKWRAPYRILFKGDDIVWTSGEKPEQSFTVVKQRGAG